MKEQQNQILYLKHRTTMNKILKITGLVITLAALAATALAFTRPNQITRETDALTYKQDGTFSYVTYLKPSALYDGSPEATYPSEIVSRLDFNFTFKPVAGSSSSVTINEILSNPGIWEKKIVLASSTSLTGNLNLPFSINLDALKQMFAGIEDQVNIKGLSRHLTIEAVVTSGGQTFSHDLEINLTDTLVNVANNLAQGQMAGESDFNYVVYLKPNTIFDTSVLLPSAVTGSTTAGAGDPLLIKLADNMALDYKYAFTSSQAVSNVATAVQVNAVLSAPDLWSKTFSLYYGQQGANFELKVPVDLASYSDLIDTVRNETGVSADSYKLDITTTIRVKATSGAGPIDETFIQTMKGTISRNVLTWDKALSQTNNGAIKQQVTISNDNQYFCMSVGDTRTWSLAMFIFGGAVLFSGFMIRTSPPARREEIQDELNAIRKKYHARIVDASGAAPDVEGAINLNSFEGLTSVADELGKPVVYFASESSPPEHVFCVIDGKTRYQYRLKPETEFLSVPIDNPEK